MEPINVAVITLWVGCALASRLLANRNKRRGETLQKQLVFVGANAGRVRVELPTAGPSAGFGVNQLMTALLTAVRHLMGLAWLDVHDGGGGSDGRDREVTATVRSVALTYTGRDGVCCVMAGGAVCGEHCASARLSAATYFTSSTALSRRSHAVGAAVRTTVPAWTPVAELYALVAAGSGLQPGVHFLLAGRLSDGRALELPRAGADGAANNLDSPLYALSPSTYIAEIAAVRLDAARVAAEAAAHAAALAVAAATGIAPSLPPQFVYFDAKLGKYAVRARIEGVRASRFFTAHAPRLTQAHSSPVAGRETFVPLGPADVTTVNGLYLFGSAHAGHPADAVQAVITFASGLRVFFHPHSGFATMPLAALAASVSSTVTRVEIVRDGDRVVPPPLALPPQAPTPPAAPPLR